MENLKEGLVRLERFLSDF